ncbi:hypothetical protein [Streptomyces sp. NPDC058240]|uniref:hypothetical protein n=1 Tax=Streptomyces sp. NPDC058240 TaxID=3346396 RepID=UPI0036EF3260
MTTSVQHHGESSPWAGTHTAVTLRAASRLALDGLGRDIVGKYSPEELECAQQELTLAVLRWQTPDSSPGLWMKARLTLLLPQQDAGRAQEHQDALREVMLQLAQERLRREDLARSVCADHDTARLWWLERDLDDPSALDWASFRETILPLTEAPGGDRTTAERLAHTILYVWEKLGEESGQQARFTAMARTLFEQMGWADVFPWPSTHHGLASMASSPGAGTSDPEHRLVTGKGEDR